MQVFPQTVTYFPIFLQTAFEIGHYITSCQRPVVISVSSTISKGVHNCVTFQSPSFLTVMHKYMSVKTHYIF